jgi:hypothetical protein
MNEDWYNEEGRVWWVSNALMIEVRWIFKDVKVELVVRKKVPAEIHGFYEYVCWPMRKACH